MQVEQTANITPGPCRQSKQSISHQDHAGRANSQYHTRTMQAEQTVNGPRRQRNHAGRANQYHTRTMQAEQTVNNITPGPCRQSKQSISHQDHAGRANSQYHTRTMQAEQTVNITPGPCRQSKQSHLSHTLGKSHLTGNHTPYNSLSLTFCALLRPKFSVRRAIHLFLRGMTKTPDSGAREGKRTQLQLRTAERETQVRSRPRAHAHFPHTLVMRKIMEGLFSTKCMRSIFFNVNIT